MFDVEIYGIFCSTSGLGEELWARLGDKQAPHTDRGQMGFVRHVLNIRVSYSAECVPTDGDGCLSTARRRYNNGGIPLTE